MQMNQTELDILQATVDAEKAHPSIAITEHHVAEAVSLDLQEIRANLRMMERKGCVQLQNFSSFNNESVWVKITPEGHMALRERYEFLNNSDHSSVNIEYLLQVENAHNSQFQQGTHNSTQNLFADNTSKVQLSELLEEIKKLAANLELDTQVSADFQSDIQTVEAQLSNSKPKNTILKIGLASIASILKGSTEKALATEMASHIPSVIQRIHEFIQSVS